MRSLLVPLVAVLVSALATSEARANGRFPSANQLVVSPSDPSFIVTRATFGLLVSRDHGQTFGWVCESAIGVDGTYDPAIAVLGADNVAVASLGGLALSQDRACAFSMSSGLDVGPLVDVAAERAHPSHAVLLATAPIDGGSLSTLVETFDGGAHWAPLGGPLPSDLLVETVDIAPSDGDRFYVSGAVARDGARVGVVESSRDHGATWSRTYVDLAGAASVYIGAIDPADADRVYLRTKSDTADALLVSTDGASTFRTVTTVPSPMLGLAVSPDGRRVAIGGPAAGVRVADKDALEFEQRGSTPVACLAWSADGLFACGNGASGFVIGLSADDGATFAPRLATLGDIAGPLATCAGPRSVAQTCAAEWQALAALIGADAGAPPRDALDDGATPPRHARASTGCAVREGPSSGASAALALVACAAVARRRRARG